ncbi:hypothetical protein V2A85_24800, partial [Yersinia sp. 1252 StPb PI]
PAAWATILAIHGTTAVLSIAFMDMFIEQTASSSYKHFESICRSLILRKYKVLNFGLIAICSLIIGVCFLITGAGIV